MKQFVLDNFIFQSSKVPANPVRQPHYMMQGVYPDYANFSNGLLGEQSFPLAAAPVPLAPPSSVVASGNIVQMIPSADPTTYSVFAMTDDIHVYAYDGYFDLGIPFGSHPDNPTGTIELFGSNLLAAYNLGANIYRMDLSTRAWTSVALGLGGGIHNMKSFLDFCAIADGLIGTQRLVRKITSSYTITNGIDLGFGWSVIAFENYNNKYLAIAASQSTTLGGNTGAPSYTGNYIFLWNGISDRYNYAIRVPGKFCNFTNVGDTLYVMVQKAPHTFVLYYLVGLSLRPIHEFNYGVSAVNNLCSFNDKVCVATDIGVLVIDPATKASYFVTGGASQVGCSGGLNNYFYFNKFGNLPQYFPRIGSPNFQSMVYQSHFLQAQGGQGTVASVEVYYDTPPIDVNDTIETFLTAVFSSDSNAPLGSRGNVAIALDNITSAVPGKKYTVLDGKGLMFNKLRLSTNVLTQTSGWFPIIRQIIINYE